VKQELFKKIRDKAKLKNDGVYSLSGHKYAVKEGHVVFISDYKKIYQYSQGFLVSIGKVEIYDVVKKLKGLLEEMKGEGKCQ